MNSQHLTPAVGVTGLLGTITLEHVNTSVAIAVGLMTLVWLTIKIYKEIFPDE
jgi:hypothetical protein